MKSNRKALLTSVVSLIICVTMLIGTTFAWFTDTASTSVSKIQAGTLKVQLWSANVTNGAVGESVNVGNDDKAIFSSDILWEPGYTAYRVITIKNTGNLAFEFALDVTRADGQTPTNLPEAIDAYYKVVETAPTTIAAGAYKEWGCTATPLSQIIDSTDPDGVVYGRILPANSTPDTTGYESVGEITVILALHMKETAGNEYMDKTESFDISVYAKQWTEEYDSNGNQYDKDAEYDAERTPETDVPTYTPATINVSDLYTVNGESDKYTVKVNLYNSSEIESETIDFDRYYPDNNIYLFTVTVTPNDGYIVDETRATAKVTVSLDETDNTMLVATVTTKPTFTVSEDTPDEPTPATLTQITGTINMPGYDVNGLYFDLRQGTDLIDTAQADSDGKVTFTIRSTSTYSSLTEDTTFTVYYSENEGNPRANEFSPLVSSTSLTVQVELDEATNAYKIKDGTNTFNYVSGYTKTVYNNEAGYTFKQANGSYAVPWDGFPVVAAEGTDINGKTAMANITLDEFKDLVRIGGVTFTMTFGTTGTYPHPQIQFNAWDQQQYMADGVTPLYVSIYNGVTTNNRDNAAYNKNGQILYADADNNPTTDESQAATDGDGKKLYVSNSIGNENNVISDPDSEDIAYYSGGGKIGYRLECEIDYNPYDEEHKVETVAENKYKVVSKLDELLTIWKEPRFGTQSVDTITNFTVQLWTEPFTLYSMTFTVPTPSN